MSFTRSCPFIRLDLAQERDFLASCQNHQQGVRQRKGEKENGEKEETKKDSGRKLGAGW